ncbi:dienelactone hydrolase family protein [Pusillimonas sp.]|uniref:dienelactone hydrolase family protein n=1 Tax=Pusillimonas sp. TaxID=3040095 RepID=UPI0037CBB497
MSFSPITGQAETAIQTSAQGLDHGTFKLPTFDGAIDAYYARPQNQSNAPVILVIQEIFGLHEHIRDICRRFAAQGYFAVSAELYQRQGDPNTCGSVPDVISNIVSKVSDEQVLADLDASAKWAGQQGGDTSRLGVTGFCWGGRITWMYMEHNPGAKAGVAWYGKLSVGHGPLQKRNPVDAAKTLNGPVLGLYGGQDTSIPLEDVRRMEAELADGNEAARASSIIVYPNSGHAFFADYRPSYREEDATDAWAKAIDWFKARL